MNTTTDAAILARIKALPIRARVAFVITLAEMVVLELAEDPEGLKVAQEALRLSGRWVSGAPVKGEDLDQYIGGPPDKHLGDYQLRYRGNERMLAAMITTTRAVGHACRMAYDVEGVTEATQISSIMYQINEDDVFYDVMDFPKKTSRYDDAKVSRVVDFLVDRYAGQGPDVLGSPLRAAEILPVIFGKSASK